MRTESWTQKCGSTDGRYESVGHKEEQTMGILKYINIAPCILGRRVKRKLAFFRHSMREHGNELGKEYITGKGDEEDPGCNMWSMLRNGSQWKWHNVKYDIN